TILVKVHWGMGATVGSVIPFQNAIVPAAVGVDIGCGMIAAKTSLTAADLPDSLELIRKSLELAIPVGRTDSGGYLDKGAWRKDKIPLFIQDIWFNHLNEEYKMLSNKH